MRSLLAIVAVFLLGGCVVTKTSAVLPEVKVARPMKSTVVAAPGSLWNSGSDGMVTDLKARRLGDILTVAIYEKASASKQATTSTSRNSSAATGLDKLFGLENMIGKIHSSIDPTSLLDTSYENDFKGIGSTTRKEDLAATLTTRVVEVMPNGNLKIAGSKTVTVNREEQLINMTGEVRPADISPGNIIDSMYVLDARIVYTGEGVISDKQGQGWLVRMLDDVWPF